MRQSSQKKKKTHTILHHQYPKYEVILQKFMSLQTQRRCAQLEMPCGQAHPARVRDVMV
jgi:hypothetical protein